MKSVNDHIKAKYSVLMVLTHEDERLVTELKKSFSTREVIQWTFSRGLDEKEANGEPVEKVLKHIAECKKPSIFVLRDYQMFLKLPGVCARLKDLWVALRDREVTVVITSARREVPVELEEVVTVLDYDLPDREYMADVVRGASQAWKLENINAEQVADALAGLSEQQASDVLALSRVKTHNIDVETVLNEKARTVAQDGTLEMLRVGESLQDVAGYDELINWLLSRRRAFSEEARAFGLPVPKGILLVGVPGCGKSLCAKAVSKSWGLPLIKCDIGSLFGGVIGASEANVRKMIRMAEAISPCVLFLDELEKGLSSSSGQNSGDSGTSARMLGTFLTWLQEKTKPVFVVASANKPEALPPELLRRGRWDEIWALDLPNQAGRASIFQVHLRKRGRDPAKFDLEGLAEATPSFTGAEIEAVVVEGLYQAFQDGARELENLDIFDAIDKTVPLAKAVGSEIDTMRSWAKGRARNAAGLENTVPDGNRFTRVG